MKENIFEMLLSIIAYLKKVRHEHVMTQLLVWWFNAYYAYYLIFNSALQAHDNAYGKGLEIF